MLIWEVFLKILFYNLNGSMQRSSVDPNITKREQTIHPGGSTLYL